MALHRNWQAAAERLRGAAFFCLRDECLTQHLFLSLAVARRIIEAWRMDYTADRSHSWLAGKTPDEANGANEMGSLAGLAPPTETIQLAA